MSKIEEGETNDPQKVNAWISRSNFGELSKIWICNISNITQNEWTSVSKGGYFNTLEWKQPKRNSQLYSSEYQSNIIGFINK